MSITKYTNFDSINKKVDNKGELLQMEDLFIVSQNQIESTDFGECKYDVMEISVYDVNNNLLPQKSGNNIAYIKKEDIQNYLYSITNAGGQNELAIDAEKLLNDLGFTNGILKININFVRSRVGNENTSRRVWIQEISPSREEIRIIPLKTADENINKLNYSEFKNLQNLNKDFKYYKKSLLDSINSFGTNFLTAIDDVFVSQYGKDSFNILKSDFGLSKFETFRNKIYSDFQTSVTYYLNNKYYDVTLSSFGKPSEERFDDCEQYDFNMLTSEIQNILFKCIDYNSYFLKRRDVTINKLPKEFQITELKKQIQNNIDSFPTPTKINVNLYEPSKITITANTAVKETPIIVTPSISTPEIKTDLLPPVVISAPAPIEIIPPVVVDKPISRSGGGGASGANGDDWMAGGYRNNSVVDKPIREEAFK
jgi:hypothetical protein